MSAWVTSAHVAGLIAVVVGCLDAWAFHAFGVSTDKDVIFGGLIWLAGVAVPSPFAVKP